MRQLIVVLCLLPAVAFAQPGATEPGEPAPAEPPPPVESASPPPTPAPAPPPPAELTPAPPPPAAPSEHTRQGLTAEISAGLGMVSVNGHSETVKGLAGLDVGVGGFVSSRIALSVRMSGVTVAENGLIYVGVLGPHVQAWLAPQLWVGAGLGIGFAAGCGGDTCGSETATGYDARVGYAFSSDGHGAYLSAELNTIDAGGNDRINLLGILLGYQGF